MLYYVDEQGKKYKNKPTTKEITGQYYFLDDILETEADMNVVISARNLGKSVSLGRKIIEDYFELGYCSAFVRRYKDQFNDPNMRGIFNDAVALGALRGTEWDNVEYMKGGWYLTKWDEELNKRISDKEPFCIGIGLNLSNQNARGMSQPKLHRIYFDEFVALGYGNDTYFPGEYRTFMNLIVTLARMKDDFKVFLFGNTQGQMDDCIYFHEWGIELNNIEKGKITLVKNNSEELPGLMAIEYVEPRDKKFQAKANKFLSFGKNNKAEQMIVNGDWETRDFPHLPFDFKFSEVKKEYYIWWKRYFLNAKIIKHEGHMITYISCVYEGSNEREVEDIIKGLDKPIIFTPYATGQRRWFKYLTKPENSLVKLFYDFFKNGQVYYETNMVGETVSAYIRYSTSAGLIEAE